MSYFVKISRNVGDEIVEITEQGVDDITKSLTTIRAAFGTATSSKPCPCVKTDIPKVEPSKIELPEIEVPSLEKTSVPHPKVKQEPELPELPELDVLPTPKPTAQVPPKLTLQPSELETKVLEALKKTKESTRKILADVFKVDPTQITLAAEALEDKKLINIIGQGKGRKYVLVEKGTSSTSTTIAPETIPTTPVPISKSIGTEMATLADLEDLQKQVETQLNNVETAPDSDSDDLSSLEDDNLNEEEEVPMTPAQAATLPNMPAELKETEEPSSFSTEPSCYEHYMNAEAIKTANPSWAIKDAKGTLRVDLTCKNRCPYNTGDNADNCKLLAETFPPTSA